MFSILVLANNITQAGKRVHSVGSIRLVSFSFKVGRNYDELARALIDYRDCRVASDEVPAQASNKDYIQKYDIVWSAFKNAYNNIYRHWADTDYWVDDGRAKNAAKIRNEGLAFVDKYQPYMATDVSITCSKISEMLNDIYMQKADISAFAQGYTELDDRAAAEQQKGMVKLFNNIVFLSVSFLATVLLTMALLYKAMREAAHAQRLSEVAGQQAIVALEDLRESVAKGVAQKNFFAAASHDLRQPLHALGLYLGSLGKHATSEQAQHILKCASLSTDSLSDLLDSLLDISKLDAGVIQSNKTEFEVSGLLTRIHSRMLPEAKEKQLELVCDVRECWVYSDEQLLDRILQNLLSNALTYTESGHIQISCENIGQQVAIAVSDTGCGIPELKQEAVFNEFYQVHNTERDRGKGLGLGLSIVRRLSELLGVSVTLKSKEGQGTTFTVTVPASGRVVAPAVTQSSKQTIELVKNPADVNVLLIDDDQDIRDGTVLYLRSLGFNVRASEDQANAVAQCSGGKFQPHLIIADYRLRDNKTGIEAVRSLRVLLGEVVPAIIVTGDTTINFTDQSSLRDASVVYKPVGSEKLQEAIANMLTKS